jgi:hypothetical protein
MIKKRAKANTPIDPASTADFFSRFEPLLDAEGFTPELFAADGRPMAFFLSIQIVYTMFPDFFGIGVRFFFSSLPIA